MSSSQSTSSKTVISTKDCPHRKHGEIIHETALSVIVSSDEDSFTTNSQSNREPTAKRKRSAKDRLGVRPVYFLRTSDAADSRWWLEPGVVYNAQIRERFSQTVNSLEKQVLKLQFGVSQKDDQIRKISAETDRVLSKQGELIVQQRAEIADLKKTVAIARIWEIPQFPYFPNYHIFKYKILGNSQIQA